MDRVYCGELLSDGTRCRGVHTCHPTEIGWVATCTNKKCTFREFYHNRRHTTQKIDFKDRRKS